MATAPPANTGPDSHVLREYLVALGFRIDERRGRTAQNFVLGMDKKVGQLGKALVATGTAVAGLAVVFSRSMERLFYSARYADTTVGRLQAMEFAGRNIGLAGGEMTAGMKSMAAALRANPGLTSMLERMGVPVKGRDMADVMWDFVRATKNMPFYVAQQFAEMFGMGPETLFNLQQGLDKAREAEAARIKMAADMGVDTQKLAEGMVDVNNQWRAIIENTSIAFSAIAVNLLPQIKQFKDYSAGILKDWIGVSKEWSEHMARTGTEDFKSRMMEGLGLKDTGGGVKLSRESEHRLGLAGDYENSRFAWFGVPRALEAWEKWRHMKDKKRIGEKPGADAGALLTPGEEKDFANRDGTSAGDTSPGGTESEADVFDPQQYLRALEQKYGLPAGLLDRVWLRESSRGKNMLSPKGARGHFGFMPKTGAAYGLKDPDDFVASGDASARMWRDLLQQYGGDLRTAAIAYNWGSGNIARRGLGAAPDESRGYADFVAGPTVNTDITIHGVHEPEKAAESVVRRQRDVMNDAIRNIGPRMK